MAVSFVATTSNNQIYITHAEFQECFIKIWATNCFKTRESLESCLQNYRTFTKELTKLHLNGNSLYVYILKMMDCEEKVYRCQVLSTDLVKNTHSIQLIDYGPKFDVPFHDVREVIDNVDESLLISLSQKPTVNQYLLSGYLSIKKTKNELNNILCNKYYKYRKDFEVYNITFISLFDVEKVLTESHLASTIDLETTLSVAYSLSLTLKLNNESDMNNSSILNKTSILSSIPKYLDLDYATLIHVAVTRVSCNENIILLTVRTIDNDFISLTKILNSVSLQNLKLAPILEVHTPCLVIKRDILVRAIILEVENDRLLIDLVDYGTRDYVPRTDIFEIPSNCNVIKMQSMNVVVDIPLNFKVDESMFLQKYFQMLPVKIDPCFGLYKVKLYNKINGNLIDILDLMSNIDVDPNKQHSAKNKSPELLSITERNVESEENLKTDKSVLKLNHLQSFPITFLQKEHFEVETEMICSLVHYKSPFHFYMRKYNPSFESFMDQIRSTLNSHYILKKHELIIKMYVIYQNQLGSVYRAQIIDLDLKVEMIKLHLVDEGGELIHEYLSNMTLYNFIESDCELPGQLILECSLNNMWFPVINTDTKVLLQPYFNIELLYYVQIVKTNELGINLVEMKIKDSNTNISDLILKSGIGQRLCAVMKTGETPYEENLLIGQSFLSYVYYDHHKLYIQPEPNTVDELEEEILKYIKDNSNLEPLDVNYLRGTYCLATVNNIQWYRAHIRNINEDSIIVFMFDIGLLTELSSFKQIQSISYNLMKKPQLCLNCYLENKTLNFMITEKTLYNVTVKYINKKGELCVTVDEHLIASIPNPIVRSLEEITFVHVDGDLTYLQRSQDILNLEKMSKTLSELNGELENKTCIVPGDVNMFESRGKYYRCIVKSVISEMAVVHCIDYGFEKRVEKKKLQYLGHLKIALLPALVITVKTFPMAFIMPDTNFLANIYLDEGGTLNVVPDKISLNQPNKLIETLKSGCLVKITYINSCNDCWIVPNMFLNNLKTISDALDKMQSKVIPAVTEVGSLCAALHSKTKKWHRALLLDKDNENQITLSIDSGELFKASKTTKLLSSIQKIPNCALHCEFVSNLDIKKLLNKYIKCKLISSDQSLLKVELFSEDLDKPEIFPIQSLLECTVVVYKFVSFKKFYVQKVDDKKIKDITNTNSQLTSVLTENQSIGQLYDCYVEDNCLDDCLNDSTTFSTVLDIMMKFQWTMKTYSGEEPYNVTLAHDGVNCIDIVNETLNKVNIVPNNKGLSIAENIDFVKPRVVNSNIAQTNLIDNSLNIPEVETVTIERVDTFQYFYAHSTSLHTSYINQIMNDLDICTMNLPLDHNLIGSVVVTSSQKINHLCRAKIETINSDSISAYCYLLDFGTYENCTEFYTPTNFLSTCPPLVRRCSLYIPELDGKEDQPWFYNISDMLRDINFSENIEYQMIVIEDGDPCLVTLQFEHVDISKMLIPLNVNVHQVNSLDDFKAIAISDDQKTVNELLKSGITMSLAEDPIIGNIYLAEIKSKLKRVKFEEFNGDKYVVFDMDFTLDKFFVDSLYTLPENMRNIPIFAFRCSFIFKDEEEKQMYSLEKFKKLANAHVDFTMCLIIESEVSTNPHLVKLYLDDKDILDIIKKIYI